LLRLGACAVADRSWLPSHRRAQRLGAVEGIESLMTPQVMSFIAMIAIGYLTMPPCVGQPALTPWAEPGADTALKGAANAVVPRALALPIALLITWQALGTAVGTRRTPSREHRQSAAVIASGDLPAAILRAWRVRRFSARAATPFRSDW
jgi:hypothetical protein